MKMKTKSKAGGGANSRQVRKVGIKTGPASTNKMSPCAANQLGNHLGNPAAVEPLKMGTAKQVPLGNAVATNVNGGGPGKGRVLYGQSGYQAQHSGSVPKLERKS
jgi:hypothetical protein